MAKLFGGNSSNLSFADRKQLAADGTPFCIEGARLVTQRDGKIRWYLTIWHAAPGDLVAETLTFDRSPSRDATFEELNSREGAFPLHNCKVEKREFKAKNSALMQSFYDIDVADGHAACPCGGETTTPEPVVTPDTTKVPF